MSVDLTSVLYGRPTREDLTSDLTSTRLDRELRNAKRMNENCESVTYGAARAPPGRPRVAGGVIGHSLGEIDRQVEELKRSSQQTSEHRPAWSGPFANDLDPYELSNESLRNFLILQGVSKTLLDQIGSRDGLLLQLSQFGFEPTEDIAPLSPRLRRMNDDLERIEVQRPLSPPPPPQMRAPAMWNRDKFQVSEDFLLTVGDAMFDQEREAYCYSYVSDEQRQARERRLMKKVERMEKKRDLVAAGAEMIRQLEARQAGRQPSY